MELLDHQGQRKYLNASEREVFKDTVEKATDLVNCYIYGADGLPVFPISRAKVKVFQKMTLPPRENLFAVPGGGWTGNISHIFSS